MGFYADWGSLVAAAEQKVATILKQDVAPVAEEIVKSHIQSDIYYAYTPQEGAWVNGSTYQRRHVLEDSIESTMLSNNTLLITSNASASPSILKGSGFRASAPGAFLQMLESGNTGIWKKGFARPAIAHAQIEIDDSIQGGALSSAIERGIKREFS